MYSFPHLTNAQCDKLAAQVARYYHLLVAVSIDRFPVVVDMCIHKADPKLSSNKRIYDEAYDFAQLYLKNLDLNMQLQMNRLLEEVNSEEFNHCKIIVQK